MLRRRQISAEGAGFIAWLRISELHSCKSLISYKPPPCPRVDTKPQTDFTIVIAA